MSNEIWTFRSKVMALTALVIVGPLAAKDEVRYQNADGKMVTASGTINRENREGIEINTTNGDEKIPFQTIDQVKYDKQPIDLISARSKFEQGRFEEVIADYKAIGAKIDKDQEYLQAFVAFRLFACYAELAIIDPSRAAEATSLFEKFNKAFPDSRHFYPSYEYLGRVYLGSGDYTKASEAFSKLSAATFPGAKQKAEVYKGLTALRAGKLTDAAFSFDQVIKTPGDTGVIATQKFLARVLKGEVMVKQNKAAEAEKYLREVVSQLPSDTDPPIAQAMARNALGDALRAVGRDKEALLEGYLWVVVRHSKVVDEVPRALFHASQIFGKIGQPERAAQFASRLKEEFPGSSWAKQ